MSQHSGESEPKPSWTCAACGKRVRHVGPRCVPEHVGPPVDDHAPVPALHVCPCRPGAPDHTCGTGGHQLNPPEKP